MNFQDRKENVFTGYVTWLPSAACCHGGEKWQGHFQVQISRGSSQMLYGDQELGKHPGKRLPVQEKEEKGESLGLAPDLETSI